MDCYDAIKVSNDEILLKLYVVPNSTYSLFPAGYNPWRRCIEIKVKNAAKDNKANKEVVENIATYFHISLNEVTIVSGKKRREKTISIKKVSKENVYKKIMESINGL
jgi:uncharacterized protein (TIGR00251 family)